MPIEIPSLDDFLGFDGPHKDTLEAAITQIYQTIETSDNDDARRGVTDALYFSVKKRLLKRRYEGNEQAYLIACLSDISNAKSEHNDVCYSNDHADDTFFALKSLLTGLMM